jgi:hypothetical protein
MSRPVPSTQQILDQMRVTMGEVPPAIEKAAAADARMVAGQARSSAFAMPPEDGALDPETPRSSTSPSPSPPRTGRARSPW